MNVDRYHPEHILYIAADKHYYLWLAKIRKVFQKNISQIRTWQLQTAHFPNMLFALA